MYRAGEGEIVRPYLNLPGDYLGAVRLLVADLEAVFEYIEPSDQNLSTYSHRLYSLLLRACTEFESLAKEMAISLHGDAREFRSMTQYRSLDREFKLSLLAVDVLPWRPAPRRVVPFQGWRDAEPKLGWYQSYNAVKHNRSEDFASASLGNTVEAVAGVFAVVAILGVLQSDGAHWHRGGGSHDGRRGFVNMPFELIELAELTSAEVGGGRD